MLDGIKTSFSISDLEELSGVSAHSIRIWERRYQLFEPLRTEGNIRRYTNQDLKKLLNISFLLQAGFKISDLATFTDPQLSAAVNAHRTPATDHQHVIHELKLAMLQFNTQQFDDIYGRLATTMPFYEIFLEVMIPFLEHIGTLWQTNTITVAHEHYVSNLLRQKLFYQIERLPKPDANSKVLYVLFLPIHELHELGLLFLHYSLLLNGLHTVYLGPDVGFLSLEGIPTDKPRIFMTYLTFAPPEHALNDFFEEARKTLLKPDDQLHALGYRLRDFKPKKTWKNIFVHSSLKNYIVQNKTILLSK